MMILRNHRLSLTKQAAETLQCSFEAIDKHDFHLPDEKE